MALEQKYLNVTTRAEAYMDIMMYIPDTSVSAANITSNDILQYSNISKLTNIKEYTSTTIATLEENLWLLNGGFINPTVGRTYYGYISNTMSDEDGNFETNPYINIELSTTSKIEYFSIILNPSVTSGYPKQIITTFSNSDGTDTYSITTDITTLTTLPNVILEVNKENVNNIKMEFVSTVSPYRRIRVSSVMFGKVMTLNQDEVISTDYLDKCSYVPDSIPSRTFSFDLNNYEKKYNIDNPENYWSTLDNSCRVLVRNGYNIYGYQEDSDGNGYIDNPDKVQEIEWDDWKELRLSSISTDGEDTCTFECGSVLDIMEDNYTKERFINNRTVSTIVADLLDFMHLPTTTITFSSDSNGKSYGDYTINTVLPELPVRELIQLLAFSVGATLLIKNDGTVKFANLDLDDKSSFTHQHTFTYTDFESTPSAEQLETTTKISLPKYNSTIGTDEETIQTVSITSYTSDVSYSDCVPTSARKSEKDTSDGTVQDYDLYAHRGTLTCNLPTETSLSVDIIGYKIDTTTSQERSVTADTLVIDTQLIKEDPNNIIKNKYLKWYGKKFKYTMDTRGEPLVDAGDYAEIETPFSGTDSLLKTYVLQNHIAFDGTWSGDMEVVAL